VHVVGLHLAHQHGAGTRRPNGVVFEVDPAGRADMERTAGQRAEALLTSSAGSPGTAISGAVSLARTGTLPMSGSSYCPMSAV